MPYPDKVILIDAKNLVYRHNAVNEDLARGDGFPTGALHGCLNTMIAFAKYIPDTPIVWVWDGDGETWRHRLMIDNSYLYTNPKNEASTRVPTTHKKVGYKANRNKKYEKRHTHSKFPTDTKLRGALQIPVLRLVLDGCGFRNYQIPNIEADDVLAILSHYLVKHTDMEVIIHSGDKDFYQLMGHRVKILSRIHKGRPLFVHRRDVEKKYGVTLKNWAKFRAWMGDPSDNIPHIQGIGPVAAREMVNAGLDPSLELRDIDDRIAKQFANYFEPVGIVQRWPFVQTNYKLCKLVTRESDSRLPKQAQKAISHLLRHLHLRRDKHKINSESYRRVGHLLMSYELKTILSKRDVLWRVP